MRVFKATIRTVQDIVNNLLNSFLLVRLEGEGHLPAGLLALVDQIVHEARREAEDARESRGGQRKRNGRRDGH